MLQFLIDVIGELRKRLDIELGRILFLLIYLIRTLISTKLQLLTLGSPRCLEWLFSLRFEYRRLAIPAMSLIHEIRIREVHLDRRLLLLIGNDNLGVRAKRGRTDDESI